MVYCSKCGQQNAENAQYCARCGNPILAAQPTVEQRLKQFGEEVEKAGERLGKEIETRSQQPDSSFDRSFSFFSPLIKALIAFIVLVIIGEALNAIGDRSTLAHRLSDFLIGSNNLGIFLLLFAVFAYAAYISKKKLEGYRYIQPFVAALGIAFAIWVVFSILDIIGHEYDIEFFTWASDVMWIILPLVFILIILVGYSGLLNEEHARRGQMAQGQAGTPPYPAQQPFYQQPGRRMYRSGRDRVLGGVCGGMAEYLNIDPTMMRIIWILLVIAGIGSFVLIYFILWIIIPRDPTHPWT